MDFCAIFLTSAVEMGGGRGEKMSKKVKREGMREIQQHNS